MLTLFHNGSEYPIQNTEYYIRELANGLDEVIFDISIYDPIYAIMAEEENIVDRAGQAYKVKQIDAGADVAHVVCQLDIDDWKATLSYKYNSGSKTVAQQIDAVKPAGWSVYDHSGSSISRTISGDYTPYDICVRCTEVYNVYIRWDNKTKHCDIYTKAMGSPVGAFATRELNLKEINYKGKSNNLITRLYAYGKDGLSFASINSGNAYVDNNTYTNRIICGIWIDERYTVAADLLADAQEKLALMAVPERSYDCSIVDLQATNPSLYNNLRFTLFTAATLIDDVKETAVDYQVVERHIYPYHPEDNAVIFNNSPIKITESIINIVDEIENPNSDFQQIQQQRIAEATDWLTSADGYIYIVRDANGWWKEIYMMDTNDPATAVNVFRLNNNGIGISNSGVNGPYVSAWTIDGKFNCDWLLAGSINANLIKAGIITDLAGKFSLNMITGALSMQDGTFSGSINGGSININNQFTVDNTGSMTAKAGYIGSTNGFKINNGNICNGPQSISDYNTNGACYSTTGLRINASKTTLITGDAIVTTGNIQGDTVAGTKITGDSFTFTNQNGGNGYFVSQFTDYITDVVISNDETSRYFAAGRGGTWYYGSNGSGRSSDRRLKHDIKELCKDKIRKFFKILKPSSFKMNSDPENTRYGVIAQNTQEALEKAGLENGFIIQKLDKSKEQYLSVTYSEFHAFELAAIKDLYEIVDRQQAEIDMLKARIEVLKNG